MEHLIFLIQIISLILAFASLIILMQNYSQRPDRAILFFAGSLMLIMMRTIIFAIARYGNLSRFFVFSVRFPMHFSGGLVYVSLVFISHFLLILAMSHLSGKKIPTIVYILFSAVSLYSMGIFFLLMRGVRLPFIPESWKGVTGMAVVPVLSAKAILVLCGSGLAFYCRKESKLSLFLVLISMGQAADGIFYAFAPWRPFTLILTLILPYSAYLIILPPLLKKQSIGISNDDEDLILVRLAKRYGFSDEEKEIVSAIRKGMSNKEIAFDRNTTLSIIKHRIFQLYKKCGINSRWELLSLLSKGEAKHV